MSRTIRLFPLTLILSLALVPAASAATTHHWHGPYDGSDPQWTNPWDNQAPSQQTQPPQPTQPPQGGQPTQFPQPSQPGPGASPNSNGNPGWNPNQGDPAENPSHNPWNNIPALPVSKTPTVAGKTAMIRRNGLAAIPRSAPAKVRAILSAANTIIGKPYKWGGGHGRLFDSGYDCSGSVSYSLIRAGLLGYPMVSGTFARGASGGTGKYVTIYANAGHVYMEVAGLRLDTSSVGDPSGKSGVRWRPPIGKRFGFKVRHIGGL